MELLGLQRCFNFLEEQHTNIAQFISDRHTSVAKWLRESVPTVRHYYDIWHVARSITKKLLKAGKEKDCEVILKWVTSIRNHLYWCATSTKEGFGKLTQSKWKSLHNHIQDKHNHDGNLFKSCVHEHLEKKRKWIKNGNSHGSLLLLLS